jgi:acyl-CoA dehydrogenase
MWQHGIAGAAHLFGDRFAWPALGEMGALLPSAPEAYGGLGATFA